jgi:hypothetical protein
MAKAVFSVRGIRIEACRRCTAKSMLKSGRETATFCDCHHGAKALAGAQARCRWRIGSPDLGEGATAMNTTAMDIRDLSLTELDQVSGGAKNIDNPLVQAFLKGFEDGQKKVRAEILELARNSGGGLGRTVEF